MKKILITGSEGFIGKKLIDYLIKKFKIFGVDKCNKTQDYKLYKYDLDKFINSNKVKKLKFDYIIHLAANSNPYEKNQRFN